MKKIIAIVGVLIIAGAKLGSASGLDQLRASCGTEPAVTAAPAVPASEPDYANFDVRKDAEIPVVITVPGLASRNIAGGLLSAAEGASRHDPDSYLQDRLEMLPQCAAITIVPFRWGRTFGDTGNALERFVPQLVQTYDAYKNTGRPIYILAHSWGAVIMHDVLHRVAKLRPDVKIDKFITLGTPLVPRLMIMDLVSAYQVRNQGLLREVSKPANLRYWENLWSSRDPFSNAIPAADDNIQIDAGLGDPEFELSQLSVSRPDLRLQINKDIALINNSHTWHKASYKGFTASLATLTKERDIEVFDSQIAPQLAACIK